MGSSYKAHSLAPVTLFQQASFSPCQPSFLLLPSWMWYALRQYIGVDFIGRGLPRNDLPKWGDNIKKNQRDQKYKFNRFRKHVTSPGVIKILKAFVLTNLPKPYFSQSPYPPPNTSYVDTYTFHVRRATNFSSYSHPPPLTYDLCTIHNVLSCRLLRCVPDFVVTFYPCITLLPLLLFSFF